jgi:TolB-like protein/Flp pilus assembly protein TadD
MSVFKRFFGEIKSRKVRKWIAIYFSSALTLLGVVNLFSSRYDLSSLIFDSLVILIVFGFPVVAVLAWHHGKEGIQKFRKREIIFYSSMGLFAVFFVVRLLVSSVQTVVPLIPRSIAVLPFANLSESKDDEYFSDGIMEDILTQISKISNFNVVSRTSVMKYKNAKKDIRDIANELGVENILEGSVRRAGNRIRITSKLIDARNDKNLWAEVYDRKIKDIFEIQSEVAQQIAIALQTKLSKEEKERIDKKATENLEAYGFYLRGREYYNQYKQEENELAIEMFNKAINLDQNFALAYAGLADAYSQRTQRFGFADYWIDSAIAISNRAISLDDNIAEPYKALGLGYAVKGWYGKALFEYLKAVKINPNLSPAVINIGGLYAFTGEWDKAYRWYRKALVLNPDKASANRLFGYMYTVLLEDSLAELWYKKTLELQPGYTYALSELCKLYIMKGEFKKARELIKDFEETDGYKYNSEGEIELYLNNYQGAKKFFEESIKYMSFDEGGGTELAFILKKLGKINESNKILEMMFDLDMKKLKLWNEDYSYRYDLARIYSINGKKEQSLEWLQKSIDAGGWMVRAIEKDPLLENIKDDDGFKKIISQLRKKIEDSRIKVDKLAKES